MMPKPFNQTRQNQAVISSSSSSPSAILFHRLYSRLRARHERHYKDSYFHFWADILLGTILVGLVIIVIRLVIWQPQPLFSLEITSPTTRVVSGGVQEFVIAYKNNEEKALTAAEIQLKLPKNFIISGARPAEKFNQNSNTFFLADIPAHSGATVSIQGIILGARGDQQSLEAVATYHIDGFRKRVLSSSSFVIEDSVLELTLEMPEAIYTEQPFSGTLHIKNTGSIALSNITINFPALGFIITSEQLENNGNILIPILNSGEEQMIFFSAKTADLGPLDFRAQVGLQVGEVIFGQKEIAKHFIASKPNLLVTTQLVSSTLDPIKPEVSATITATNLTQQTLDDVVLTVSSGREDIFVQQVSTTASVAVRGTAIHLGSLAAGKQVVIPIIINLARKNVMIEDSAHLDLLTTYSLDNKRIDHSMILGTFKFNSNLYLDSGGYYYGPQGDQLGIGPIPPQVGIPTTYWIIWQLNNIGNNLTDVTVTADVPTNIAWNERQSVTAGEIKYSPVTHRVLWEVGDIARGGGNYRASFAVTLVPETGDLRTVPTLVESIKLTAKDTFTGAIIEKSLPIITTDLEHDPLAAKKGTVRASE